MSILELIDKHPKEASDTIAGLLLFFMFLYCVTLGLWLSVRQEKRRQN